MSFFSALLGSGDQTTIQGTNTGTFQNNSTVNLFGDVSGQSQDTNPDVSARSAQDGTPGEVQADLALGGQQRGPSGVYGDVSEYGQEVNSGLPAWALPALAGVLTVGGVLVFFNKGKTA